MIFTAERTTYVDVCVEGLPEEEARTLAAFLVDIVGDQEPLEAAEEYGEEEIIDLVKRATKAEVLWPGMPDQTGYSILPDPRQKV